MEPFSLTRAALATHASTLEQFQRIRIVAAGKAAWPMAQAAVAYLGIRLTDGVVSGPPGNGSLPHQLEWLQGGHPLPDIWSVRAAQRAVSIAGDAGRNRDLLLVLLSGGGSSMLALPANGLTIDDKRQTTDALSRAGVPIADLNCVRKHLSSLKGGRLAAAAGGTSLTLAISDVNVPEDDPATIASGPTVADPTTFGAALRILDEARVTVPAAVRTHLQRGADGTIEETLKQGDPRLDGASFRVIGSRRTAMEGAAREARQRGYGVRVIDPPISGYARQAGRAFAETSLSDVEAGPTCVLASGETTVAVSGGGRGGRNQEFALGAVPPICARSAPAVLASAGTDGVDGPTDAAGALISSRTQREADVLGLDLADALARNDAYPALDQLGALLRWGPTLTNVGDIHVLVTMKS